MLMCKESAWLRRTPWMLSGSGLLAVCALVMLVVTQPAIAAFGCPKCFGFERVAGHIYVDPHMGGETRAMLLRADADATRRLTPLFGSTSTDPVILACSDEDCQHRIAGGGARGMSYASYGLRLSPRGLDPATVAHERTLIELQHRIGLVGFMRGDIPEWFLEGVAVIVSDNPRDLLPETTMGSRCRAKPTGALPSGAAEWRHMGATDNRIYARAACRVLRWMNVNGGPQAVGRLVTAVARGGRFADLYQDSSP